MDKETHVANLIALSKADGQVDAHELIFIQSMALRMGIDGSAFQRIVKYPDLVPQRLAPTREGKLYQIAELIILAGIDQKRTEEETALIYKLGVKSGLSTQELDKMMAYLSKNKMPESPHALEEALRS